MKKAILAYFKKLFQHSPGDTEEYIKYLSIASNVSESRTRQLKNISIDYYNDLLGTGLEIKRHIFYIPALNYMIRCLQPRGENSK
jgi:hypothetical protein